jgi:hypothetical protein
MTFQLTRILDFVKSLQHTPAASETSGLPRAAPDPFGHAFFTVGPRFLLEKHTRNVKTVANVFC